MIELVRVDKQIEKILDTVNYEFIYKLVKDNKIIGYGTINKDKENIMYIFIENELRGNGYGTLLFSKMIQEVKNIGYKEARVIFGKENIQMLKIVKNAGGLHLSTNERDVRYLIPIM